MASSNVHFFSWIKAFRGATLPPKSPVMSGAFFLAPELKAPPVSYFDWSSLLHSISCWASSTSPQMQSLIPKVSTHSKLQSSRQVLFDYDSADWEILLYALSKKNSKTHKQTNKQEEEKKTLQKSNWIFCFLKILQRWRKRHTEFHLLSIQTSFLGEPISLPNRH